MLYTEHRGQKVNMCIIKNFSNCLYSSPAGYEHWMFYNKAHTCPSSHHHIIIFKPWPHIQIFASVLSDEEKLGQTSQNLLPACSAWNLTPAKTGDKLMEKNPLTSLWYRDFMAMVCFYLSTLRVKVTAYQYVWQITFNLWLNISVLMMSVSFSGERRSY